MTKTERKHYNFAKLLANNPKLTPSQAYKTIYGGDIKDSTATVNSSKLLQEANVMAILHSKAFDAEETLTDVMTYSRDYGKRLKGSKQQGAAYAAIAERAASNILDRVHGKAVQRIQATSSHVVLSIDLSGQASHTES